MKISFQAGFAVKRPTLISGGILLDIVEEKLADEIVSVTNEDARNMAHRLSREEVSTVGCQLEQTFLLP